MSQYCPGLGLIKSKNMPKRLRLNVKYFQRQTSPNQTSLHKVVYFSLIGIEFSKGESLRNAAKDKDVMNF